jgi:hypothetical protein
MWTVWVVATLAGADVIASSRDIGEPSAIRATITMVPLLGLTALVVRWLGASPSYPKPEPAPPAEAGSRSSSWP